jgi:hypothetical protein
VQKQASFETFPFGIVVLTAAVAISIYALGVYVLLGVGITAAVLYGLYCLAVEGLVLKRSCANCYYYGKRCGLGRGTLCAVLFKKGDPSRFVEREVAWTDMVPDFLVVLLPIAGGIVLSIRDFAWLRVAALALLVGLSFVGNAVSRGMFACRYCKQREIGCPAATLFGVESAD